MRASEIFVMHAALRAEAVCEARALLHGSKDRPPAGANAPAATAITMPPNAFLHLLCISLDGKKKAPLLPESA